MDISPAASLFVPASPATSDRTGAQSAPSGGTASRAAPATAAPVSSPAAPTVSAAQPDSGAQSVQTPGQVDQAVRQVNEAFNRRGQNLYAAFERDRETGIQVVKIVDGKTNETVVQMPPKAVLAFAQSLTEEEARGRLLHDQA